MKDVWDMTAEELAEETRQYDKPLPASQMKPMSPEMRRQWEKARKGGAARPAAEARRAIPRRAAEAGLPERDAEC